MTEPGTQNRGECLCSGNGGNTCEKQNESNDQIMSQTIVVALGEGVDFFKNVAGSTSAYDKK